MRSCRTRKRAVHVYSSGVADTDKLFSTTLNNIHHVLQSYLPDGTETTYNLRNRTHNKSRINKTNHLNDKDFIIRMYIKTITIVTFFHMFYFFTFHNFYKLRL